MKKINFSDKFGLTQAVLDGRKTQTRRIIKFSPIDAKYVNEEGWSIGGYVASEIINHYSRFKVGEVVAVAQSYSQIGIEPFPFCEAGWRNKLFVQASKMRHFIRITNVRVERLQDISDEDCIKEGVCKWTKDKELYKYDLADGFEMFEWRDKPRTPREAYAALIDKISGKGTWDSNPWVFVYEFELVD